MNWTHFFYLFYNRMRPGSKRVFSFDPAVYIKKECITNEKLA